MTRAINTLLYSLSLSVFVGVAVYVVVCLRQFVCFVHVCKRSCVRALVHVAIVTAYLSVCPSLIFLNIFFRERENYLTHIQKEREGKRERQNYLTHIRKKKKRERTT